MNTQTLPEVITFNQLERTSKNWDRRTVTILLAVSGEGNMFGGRGRGYLLTLHGENSVQPTGQIDIVGVFHESYNIARGENGPNTGSISFYRGATELSVYTPEIKPTYCVRVEGSCETGRDTLCTMLGAKMDWIVK